MCILAIYLSFWHSRMPAEGSQAIHCDQFQPEAKSQPAGPTQPKAQLQSAMHAFLIGFCNQVAILQERCEL